MGEQDGVTEMVESCAPQGDPSLKSKNAQCRFLVKTSKGAEFYGPNIREPNRNSTQGAREAQRGTREECEDDATGTHRKRSAPPQGTSLESGLRVSTFETLRGFSAVSGFHIQLVVGKHSKVHKAII